MTVYELMEKLEHTDPDAEVVLVVGDVEVDLEFVVDVYNKKTWP